jgi:hypothetical protein
MSEERPLEGTSIDRVAVSRTSRSRGLVENFGHIASRLQYHERATGTTTSDPPLGSSLAGTLALDMPQTTMTMHRLDIPGNRDELVEEYCAWQQEQVQREDQKAVY